MRRPERKIENKKTIADLLERSLVGRMATVNSQGFPVIKPVNYVYWDGRIYIHSSKKGEKIRDIRRGSPVCFELDQPIAYAPANGPACMAGYYYRSVIIKGKAVLVRDEDGKLKVLEKLMEKYQPEGGYGAMAPEIVKKTAVIEISIQEMTGKEKLG
ncbi:MAG: pyridoxamine 5'-phosphate oxidase family protein [Deltaproteobacteria bacterium]|nr:pyridoxamine 5'-phosphate oxidase family protein [Deltaproteobacteria bacterium]MBM4324020.1 pyridoxamine 5'-phosphate oxidase family protein [Deltaproteobacteria bacterium]MBM4346914.1 pyridoxamine 5'-phosphate oxidase family protein [Deltaproteobacteria bacterium]